VHRCQFGPFRSHCDEVIHGLPCEGLLALGQEKPRQRIGPSAEIALEGSELVTSDWVAPRVKVPICFVSILRGVALYVGKYG
jgi:hypothetical protein